MHTSCSSYNSIQLPTFPHKEWSLWPESWGLVCSHICHCAPYQCPVNIIHVLLKMDITVSEPENAFPSN